MSLGKKDIVTNIASRAQISLSLSRNLLDTVIELIKNQSNSKIVKIAGFGRFQIQKTPTRLGRNPKTKEHFVITERSKLSLKPSQNIKNILN